MMCINPDCKPRDRSGQWIHTDQQGMNYIEYIKNEGIYTIPLDGWHCEECGEQLVVEEL